MKTLKYYQVDTFTNQLFKGNPAGVCPLEEWLDDTVMQSIALENNLSETAFYVKKDYKFQIRWFTPTTEVDLCGHATLASAFVEFNFNNNPDKELIFQSKSGELRVSKNNELLTLDFPMDTYSKIEMTQKLSNLCDTKTIEAYKAGGDILLVFDDENTIRNCKPSFQKIKQIKARGVTITAKGSTVDFVSRFFGPQSGIDEDPVTGSTHTYLTPYWSTILNKETLNAKQVSERGGDLICTQLDDRVKISGEAILYQEGRISY